MISTRLRPRSTGPSLGISAVAHFQPAWMLNNAWFESMPRKFVKHTGIEQRPVSTEDEVALALHATGNLIDASGCNPDKCAGLVFTSPSLVPVSIARKYPNETRVADEQMIRLAHRFAEQMRIRPRLIAATNTFCAGYARALSIVKNKFHPVIQLQPDEFVLVLTASRISRITDYGCRDTAGLFGDLATATMIARTDSIVHPVHFELLDAHVERKPVNRPFFDFHYRQHVVFPTADGGQQVDPGRIVFSMDGMGIADTAPRAMASAATAMLNETGLSAGEIRYIIPHQAGTAIVRLAEMKLRDAGFTGEVINGMTCDVGNVSSGSIPYTLSQIWDELDGYILCPIASVGPPGRPVVAQGCIALRTTTRHQTSEPGVLPTSGRTKRPCPTTG